MRMKDQDFRCPHCGGALHVKDINGETVKCQYCDSVLPVPSWVEIEETDKRAIVRKAISKVSKSESWETLKLFLIWIFCAGIVFLLLELLY